MTKKLPWSPRGPEVDQLQCPVVRFLHGEHQDVIFIQVLEPLKNGWGGRLEMNSTTHGAGTFEKKKKDSQRSKDDSKKAIKRPLVW